MKDKDKIKELEKKLADQKQATKHWNSNWMELFKDANHETRELNILSDELVKAMTTESIKNMAEQLGKIRIEVRQYKAEVRTAETTLRNIGSILGIFIPTVDLTNVSLKTEE